MESNGNNGVKKTPKKMTVSVFKKELNDLSKSQLINLLVNCYKLSKEVQQYLSVEFKGQESVDELYEKYKLLIKNEFFPKKRIREVKAI